MKLFEHVLFLFDLIEMEMKIIEPIRKPLKEFENPDEFNMYYHKHKDEIDNQTTHMLNRKYKINGYKITKLKGVLCMKKIGKNYYQQSCQHSADEEINKNNELIERISIVEQRINEIIDYINNNSADRHHTL